MLEGREMEKESASGRLRVALVGKEKNGKSVLISTAPGNKLYLDFDQRAEAVAGRKGVYAITFKDPQWPRVPEVAEEVLDLMTKLEQSLDLSKLTDRKGNRLFPNVPPETMITLMAFDSISSYAKNVMDYETYNNDALCRKVKIGPTQEIRIPKSFDAWNGETQGVSQAIMRAFALPLDVFCTFHEADEEANDSTDEKPRYTGRVTIYPVRYSRVLLKYFNEVWRVRLTAVPSTNGVSYLPRVYPLPDYSMDSCTTMQLDPIEEPNIAAMIAKHESRTRVKGFLPAAAPTGVAGVAGVSKK